MKKSLLMVTCISLLSVLVGCEKKENSNSSQSISNSQSSSLSPTIKSEIKTDKDCYELMLNQDEISNTKITYEVFEDHVLIEHPEVIFQIKDPTIISIDESGIITAKKAGKTIVDVTYKNAVKTILIKVYEPISAEQVNRFEEPYVHTYGRVYKSGNSLKLDHVASGLEFSFYGSSLTASSTLTGNAYIRIFVDEDKEGVFKQMPGSVAVNMPLLTDLSEDFHTVRILKSSEIGDGQILLRNFQAKQFFIPDEKPELKLEFIGDSITTGYGALGTKLDSRKVENSDACKSYAYYTVQNMNADFSMIALEGICVNVNMWQPTYKMMEVYKQVSPLNNLEYDFEDEVDAVILNLGTNDAYYINHRVPAYASKFADDYADFLSYIRLKRPNAYIVCMYGNMGKDNVIDNGIKATLEKLNDSKISYYSNLEANKEGASNHPSKENHQKVGLELSTYLDELLCDLNHKVI